MQKNTDIKTAVSLYDRIVEYSELRKRIAEKKEKIRRDNISYNAYLKRLAYEEWKEERKRGTE